MSTVRLPDELHDLSPMELRLAHALAEAGGYVSRQELLVRVWGWPPAGYRNPPELLESYERFQAILQERRQAEQQAVAVSVADGNREPAMPTIERLCANWRCRKPWPWNQGRCACGSGCYVKVKHDA